MQRTAEIVANARQAGIAIPAFNIPYLPMMAPVIQAVADLDSFALVAVARLEWIKFESRSLAAVRAEFERCQDPAHVRLHLDHVPVVDEDGLTVDYLPIIEEAIGLGYQSAMVDGSRLELAENIAATRRAVELAHAAGIACEAELGAVMGHESGPAIPYDELFASGKGFTDVGEATRFVAETGCDWLSVAVGNVHGAISAALKDRKKVTARLNLERLEQLAGATRIPLVLHGGSGIGQEDLRAAVQAGIAKVNIATEIRQAYESALRSSGSVAAGQQAVYDRTHWLIQDFFGWAGISGPAREREGGWGTAEKLTQRRQDAEAVSCSWRTRPVPRQTEMSLRGA
ncbi:MAG: class II fructose-bisphosphate aldolase [Chloroflexi bacterium]|nr:class II fructose-bisphosphate aldolase [Chloroflexota bacterium]